MVVFCHSDVLRFAISMLLRAAVHRPRYLRDVGISRIREFGISKNRVFGDSRLRGFELSRFRYIRFLAAPISRFRYPVDSALTESDIPRSTLRSCDVSRLRDFGVSISGCVISRSYGPSVPRFRAWRSGNSGGRDFDDSMFRASGLMYFGISIFRRPSISIVTGPEVAILRYFGYPRFRDFAISQLSDPRFLEFFISVFRDFAIPRFLCFSISMF